MTYEAHELSAELGSPLLLAVFVLGTKTWRFVGADDDVVLGADTYTAAGISIDKIRQSGDLIRNTVKLSAPWNFPIAELWRLAPPTDTVAVILKEVHAGDTDAVQSWLGHVANVSWPAPATSEVMLAPGVMAMRATGLRRLFQRSCPHVTFGPACGLNAEDFKASGTVADITGLTVQADVFGLQAPPWYRGGFIRWTTTDGITEHRFITEHSGDTVTLMTPPTRLALADAFDAFPGDDHTIDTCANKFSNAPNFGGLPYFATRNPFDGDPVF